MDTKDFDFLPLVEPLLSWYEEKKRILPWRSSPTPYHVWISEIMLQQTRVDAVKPYYERFLKALPDVKALAEAPEEQYLKLWEGLGYYSRVRHLHEAALQIQENYHGIIPDTPEELMKLPGIGTYTAGAVAAIAYGKREPAVDGNVLRILSRIACDDNDILLPQTKRNAENTLKRMMEKTDDNFDPGAFNQALMDLGATVCIPNGTPLCTRCPLSAHCLAFREGKTESLPVRIRKTKRRIEERTVLLLQARNSFGVRKRPEEGLLAGLYEFPGAEGYLSKEEVERTVMEMGFVPLSIEETGEGKHIFSHVEWRMKGYRVLLSTAEPSFGTETDLLFVTKEEMEERYILPSAFRFLTGIIKEG